MESIIKELWHGNIVPEDDCRVRSPEMKRLTEYMARHHDDCRSEYASLAEEAMFTYAFKLGMRIAIETLTD